MSDDIKLPKSWADYWMDKGAGLDVAGDFDMANLGIEYAQAMVRLTIAALAQQAGASHTHVATVRQTPFGSFWIEWHDKDVHREGLQLFASSAPGGGGEGGK